MPRQPLLRVLVCGWLILQAVRPWAVAAESVCYRAATRRGDRAPVAPPVPVSDRFGQRSILPLQPAELCRTIGSAALGAVTVTRHAKLDGNRLTRRVGTQVDLATARFGTERVRVKVADRLAFLGQAGPAPPDGESTPAACYRVRGRQRPSRVVVVSDARGEHVLRVAEPTRLCVAASGAEQLCYEAKPVRGSVVDGGGAAVFATALGSERLLVGHVLQFCTDTVAVVPPPAPGFFLQIAPATISVMAGEHARLNARAFFDAGGSADWSDRLAWTSSDETVAMVRGSAGGAIVDALGPGTVTIGAVDLATGVASRDTHGDASVTVEWDLEKLTISPAAVRKPVGGTEDYTVTGHFTGGGTLNLTQRVVYSSTYSAIASAPNTPGRRSHVLARAPGITWIAARDPISGLTTTQFGNDAILRVAGGTPYIRIEPARETRLVLDVGATFQFAAIGTTLDGLTRNLTQDCVWNSAEPGVLVPAPLDGQRSRFEAVGTGTARVTCTDPVSGSYDLIDADVVTPDLTALQVRMGNPPVTNDRPRTATAIGVYAPFGPQEFTYYGARNATQDVEYVSRDPDVVATPNTPGNRSALIGVSAGTARVYAVDPATGIESPDFLVTNLGELTGLVLNWPPWREHYPVQIAKGRRTGYPITVRGRYELGMLGLTRFQPDAFELEVADPAVVRVDESFRLVGLEGGRTTVMAHHLRTGLRSDPLVVTVVGDIESLRLAPPSMRRALGESEHVTVRGIRAPDIDVLLTGVVRYESSDPSVATVSNDPQTPGLVSTVGAGTATIVAVDPVTGVRSNPASIEVLPGAIERVTIAPVSRRIVRGGSTSFTATGHYADGRTINVTPTVRWMVQRSAVALAPGGSQLAGIGPGVTQVTALHPSGVSSRDSNDDAMLSVQELASRQLTPAHRTASVGTSVWYTLVGVFADGGEINLTQSGEYFTTDGALAVAANDDSDRSRIDLLAPGTVTVYAGVFGRNVEATLTITP